MNPFCAAVMLYLQLVTRPDVVEMHDVTSRDPKLLVHLKVTIILCLFDSICCYNESNLLSVAVVVQLMNTNACKEACDLEFSSFLQLTLCICMIFTDAPIFNWFICG